MSPIDDKIISGTPAVATPRQAFTYAADYPGAVLSRAEILLIVVRTWVLGILYGIRPDIAFAMMCHETGVFTFKGDVKPSQHNIGGIGTTGGGVPGISNASWTIAVDVFFYHLLAWAGDKRGAGSPRYDKVVSTAKTKGWATTWRLLGGRWGVRDEPHWSLQATMIGNYGDRVQGHLDRILTQPLGQPIPIPNVDPPTGATPMNGKERTDHMIATLRSRGREVIDRRGLNPVNKNPAYQYGQVRGGLAGVKKVIQHWTGDGFDRATITQIVKKDYGLDTISAAMSVDDEIDLINWYAAYHITKDGNTWGGIAYGVTIFPSGRIYVNWDIGTLTYHAFSVNGYSYALCFPSSQNQGPTPACLLSANHVWYYLFEETPEIPAGWSDLYGHSEAKIFDAQNQTSCPGVVMLAQVRAARESGEPTVNLSLAGGGSPLPPPVAPSADPISTALLAWYNRLPVDVQGDKSNQVFYEADLDFSQEIASIQGWQRGIVGEYASAWFMPNGTVRPIQSTLITRLHATGKVRRR